jgi:hypothetical protein
MNNTVNKTIVPSRQKLSNGSKIIGNKTKKTTKKNCNIDTTNTLSNNQKKSNNSRNSQITSKNSCSSPSQKRKKNTTKPLKSSQNFQLEERKYNNNNDNNDNNINHNISDISSSQMIPYATNKNEVPAGLPHQTLFASRKPQFDFDSSQQLLLPVITQQDEQSQIRRMSFESSCSCCKPSVKPDEYYVVKLPGMSQLVYVPNCTIEKNDQEVTSAFLPAKMHLDHQSIRVKLPGMQNNSVPLCEEPWWLPKKEIEGEEKGEDDNKERSDDDNNNYDDDVMKVEEYESACTIEIQSDFIPNVKLPKLSYSSWVSTNLKLNQKNEVEFLDDYYHLHVTASESIVFDKKQPIVQLHPKSTPIISRCNFPNLKIETNLKLDDEDGFFKSAGGSTLSTPASEVSGFSNMSTYAETENTVYTEEEIMNETKTCNTPERRSPSVLSDISSEHLTPVLEEEEDEMMMSSKVATLPIEECQEETTLEEEIFESNTHSSNESENEDSEYQGTRKIQDHHDNKVQVEYMLPELRKIAEKLEESQFSPREETRIRRQLEIIDRDNYPDYLPLSSKW